MGYFSYCQEHFGEWEYIGIQISKFALPTHPLKSLHQVEDLLRIRGFKRPTANMAADGGPATSALEEALKPFQERASEAEVRSTRFFSRAPDHLLFPAVPLLEQATLNRQAIC